MMEDRLSNLPDEIRTHILSLLPYKEAIRSCILSTRWKFVWASVPNIELKDEDFLLEEDDENDQETVEARFFGFVNRILMYPSSPSLGKVVIDYDDHPSLVESWICRALQRNVRELHIKCSFDGNQDFQNFHQSLFTCETLVVLKLDLAIILDFPGPSLCFPSLKVLELNQVLYKDDNSAKNLISSCPVLEDLVIIGEMEDNLEVLHVISPSLKRLSVDFMEHGILQGTVIDAPALEYLHIDDLMNMYYVESDMPSIRQAHVNVLEPYPEFEDLGVYVECLFILLRKISNVTSLSLSGSTMSSLSMAGSYKLPLFHNLTHLKFFAPESVPWNWKLVLEFLKSCPMLEVLIFEGFSFSCGNIGTSWSEWHVPKCLGSHIKTIEITGYKGNNGAEQLRYFVEHAKVLDNPIVIFQNFYKNDRMVMKTALSVGIM